MHLVLASTSKYRRLLVEKLRIPFEAVAPGVDEDRLKSGCPDLKGRELAVFLAEAKIRSLESAYPDACIVGGDQLVAFEGRVLGKPRDEADAFAQIRAYSGKRFELVTAMGALCGGRYESRLHLSRYKARELSDAQIRRYLEVDRPYDCAGSFRFEDHGILLFESVETSDPLANMGLSLISLVSLLEGFGFEIPGPL